MINLTKEFVGACLKAADDEHSKITHREIELFGLSSSRLKHLLNNLCSKDGTSYLELGVYRGSTILSAAYGNKGTFTGVDNFKYDPREPKRFAAEGKYWTNVESQLEANLVRYRSNPNSNVDVDNVKVIRESFQKVQFDDKDRFNVCFFDVEPVDALVYDKFFEHILVKNLTLNSVVVFTNYSNNRHSKELNEALIRHADKVEVSWSFDRLSSGLSDSTKYYSGYFSSRSKEKTYKE